MSRTPATEAGRRFLFEYRHWFYEQGWTKEGWDAEKSAANFAAAILAIEAQARTAVPEIDVESIAVLRKALDIGSISHTGDGWFASEEGYGYDDAEATFAAAVAILAALAATAPQEPE